MKVDILEHVEDGSERRIATFHWHDGELSCDNPVLWKHLMNSSGGVIIGARGKRFYPRDGLEYLQNLKYQFAGPYLFARPPEESKGAPPPPRSRAMSTLTGEVKEAPAPAPSPASRTVSPRTASPRVGPAKRRKPAKPSGPRTWEFRKPSQLPRSRDERSELPRDAMERIYGGVFRSANALRGLSFTVAESELDALLKYLAELVDIDFDALVRAYEFREEYLELRYQPPSKHNYRKLRERSQRLWQQFLEILEGGDLEACLWPLFLVRESVRCLPEHRVEWARSSGLGTGAPEPAAGTSAGEIQANWEKNGAAALRRRSLSAALIDELFDASIDRLRTAVAAFEDADFGRSEAEVRRALRVNPGDTEARVLLGDILRRLDRSEEAISELQLAVELELLDARAGLTPKTYLRRGRARTCLGRTLLAQGRVRGAIGHLEGALDSLDRIGRKFSLETVDETLLSQLHREEVVIHRLLDHLYRDLGDPERAGHHRKRAQEI